VKGEITGVKFGDFDETFEVFFRYNENWSTNLAVKVWRRGELWKGDLVLVQTGKRSTYVGLTRRDTADRALQKWVRKSILGFTVLTRVLGFLTRRASSSQTRQEATLFSQERCRRRVQPERGAKCLASRDKLVYHTAFSVKREYVR